MMYVVFEVNSTMEQKTYKRYSDAKALADKLNVHEQKYNPRSRLEYVVYHVDFYNEYVVYWETKRNLRSGLEFQQRSNTPLSCDPSSETYHSM
jgi:hypothetical protein